MRHDAAFFFRQLVKRLVLRNGLRHARDRPQRVTVAGVELLGEQNERLALRQNRVAARGVRVVDDADIRHGQAGRRRKLRGGHAHLFHMGRKTALRKLPEYRVFAGLGVAGRRQKAAHVLLKFIRYNRVILVVRHAQNVLLRGRVKLKRDRRVCHCADIIVNQSANGLFQPRAPERLAARRTPDHRLHQRATHAVHHALHAPAVALTVQHQHRVIGIHVDELRHPLVAVFLVRYRVDNGKPTIDAPLFSVPKCRRSRR